jgi:hypothetical protein
VALSQSLARTSSVTFLMRQCGVADAAQQAAFNAMHKGKFRGALDTFDKAGGVVWTEKQDDALREMAKAFTACQQRSDFHLNPTD